VTTSRSAVALAAACLKARTKALTPDESQKTVLLMSATSNDRALVEHGEEFLAGGVGIGHVNLRGQRDHGTWPIQSTG
jgi:hypothetical protein